MLRTRVFVVPAFLAMFAGGAHAIEEVAASSQDTLGEVVSLEGTPADIVVQRQGQFVQLSPGEKLVEGDLIITGQSGRVTISTNSCERTVEPLSAVVVGAGLCKAAATTPSSSPAVQAPPVAAPVMSDSVASILGTMIASTAMATTIAELEDDPPAAPPISP